MLKRTIALICIILCLSVPAYAAESNVIWSGTNGIYGGDTVYFGNGELEWRVLNAAGTSTGGSGIFLVTKDLQGSGSQYGNVYFNEVRSKGNAWNNSSAQSWCTKFFDKNFSDAEKSAVTETYKDDKAYRTEKTSNAYAVDFDSMSLKGDKVFFLSAEETVKYFSGEADRAATYNGSANSWWLRSPSSDDFQNAGCVGDGGWIMEIKVDHNYNGSTLCARPALNISNESVLFCTPADAEKPSGLGLYTPERTSTDKWKLTIIDSTRNFSASLADGQSDRIASGDTVKIDYSGAKTGSSEYVSAAVTDPFGNLKRAGHIAASSAEGTAEVTIPSDLPDGNYILKVFSEQCRGGRESDYASQVCEIPITVGIPPAAKISGTYQSYGTLCFVDIKTEGLMPGTKIITAGYKDGKLAAMRINNLSYASLIVSLNGTFDSLKIMAVDSVGNMMPYAAAAEPVK